MIFARLRETQIRYSLFGGGMKKSVLIVDDDMMVRATIKRILEFSGYTVITAESGEACLKIFEDGFEGLILMDIMMPKMNGWDTIQALVDQGRLKGNLICMITGQEIPDDRMDNFKEHVLDYIRKPVDTKRLVAVVEQYLSYLK